MKLTETARKTIFGMLLVLGLLLPVLMNVAKADFGQKPSITIKVKNAPDNYYIALLKHSRYNESVKDRTINTSGSKLDEWERKALRTISDYNEDGWILYEPRHGVGKYYEESNSKGFYQFGNRYLSPFRVIIVTSDGEVFVSKDVEKVRYTAVFDYDVSTGEIRELIKGSRKLYAMGAVAGYILTLILEGLLLFPYGLASKKSNWFHCILVNTVTQIMLNLYLVNTVSEHMTKGIAFIQFFFIELVIFIIEAVYYGITLYKKDDTRAGRTAVGYAFIANFASFVIGSCIFESVFVEMYNKLY
ncbi:MAG: hypothetical protein II134_00935 [Lachnospiraceae bacterium]|nr:hypothetical protein [Lachnospiraceae bacterium]